MTTPKLPWYEVVRIGPLCFDPGVNGKKPYWRILVWDDFKMPTELIGVSEAEDLEVLRAWVRDEHPEAKSLESWNEWPAR